jgi:hypothetical protein
MYLRVSACICVYHTRVAFYDKAAGQPGRVPAYLPPVMHVSGVGCLVAAACVWHMWAACPMLRQSGQQGFVPACLPPVTYVSVACCLAAAMVRLMRYLASLLLQELHLTVRRVQHMPDDYIKPCQTSPTFLQTVP